jgi:hypothetical protein
VAHNASNSIMWQAKKNASRCVIQTAIALVM